MTKMPSEVQTCKECGGGGWILESSEGRKMARPCGCRAAVSRQGKLEHAGIPERYRDCTVAGFLKNGAALRQVAPIREVVLDDPEGRLMALADSPLIAGLSLAD